MFYLIVILVFFALFAYLAWRIIAARSPARTSKSSRPDSYVCPVCNEIECECHKEEAP